MTAPATTPFRVRAPGRINLIGEHVDYQDGLVLPLAINRFIEAEVTPLAENVIRLESSLASAPAVTCPLDELVAARGANAWMNYVIGVIAIYREAGISCPGFAMSVSSTLPSGAGLSSSAALETATAVAVEQLAGHALDPVQRARYCQRAEHVWAGVPCGIMDQLAVGAAEAGHALLIDCRDQSLQPIPLPDGLSLVVADTQVKHALGDGEYRKRREACEEAARYFGVSSLRSVDLRDVLAAGDALDERLYRRARHVVSEIERVPTFAEALQTGELEAAGSLMRASHDSLRDDFEVSCDELDVLVDAAYGFGRDQGLVGSRMTGGGFGGSTISLVREDATEAFMVHLAEAFDARFSRPANIFPIQAAGGACVVDPGD